MIVRLTRLALGLLCLAALAGPARAADTLEVRAEGEQRTIDCKDLDVVIEGNANTYTLRGGCHSITLHGANDKIRAAVAPGAHILVEGNDVQLTWSLVGTGADPVVLVNGRNSQVTREGMAASPPPALLPPPVVPPPTPNAVPMPQAGSAITPPPAEPAKPAAVASKPPIDITIDHEDRDLDCSGREVHISANFGLYALRGGCSAVIVHGSDNLIQAEVAPGARIDLVGKNLKLAYVPAAGDPPTVHVDGTDSMAWAISAWGGLGELPKEADQKTK